MHLSVRPLSIFWKSEGDVIESCETELNSSNTINVFFTEILLALCSLHWDKKCLFSFPSPPFWSRCVGWYLFYTVIQRQTFKNHCPMQSSFRGFICS